MRKLGELGILLLAACGGASTPATPPANRGGSAPTKPDLAGVRATLAPHTAAHFTASSIERGCPTDQTLGEYVAMLVTNGTPVAGSKDEHVLSGGCSEFPAHLVQVDPPGDPQYWYCKIDSYLLDAASGDPWHYELRLRIRKADGAPDLETFGCPGAP